MWPERPAAADPGVGCGLWEMIGATAGAPGSCQGGAGSRQGGEKASHRALTQQHGEALTQQRGDVGAAGGLPPPHTLLPAESAVLWGQQPWPCMGLVWDSAGPRIAWHQVQARPPYPTTAAPSTSPAHCPPSRTPFLIWFDERRQRQKWAESGIIAGPSCPFVPCLVGSPLFLEACSVILRCIICSH